MTTIAIVQARTSSSRLPGKVLMPIQGVPLILFQLERLRQCNHIDRLILATSKDPSDDSLAYQVANAGFTTFRGELNDVLARFHSCALLEQAKVVVRLTGDCPLADPALIDEVIEAFHAGSWDYLSNSADENQLTVPDGFDVEVFKTTLLERFLEARLPSEREHVTTWMRKVDVGANCSISVMIQLDLTKWSP